MASITRQGNGRKMIQFIGVDRHRKTLRLGKASMETARMVNGYIEAIVSARRQRVPIDSLTAEWLGNLDDHTHGKLAGVGLVIVRVKVDPKSDDDGKSVDPRLLVGLLQLFNKVRMKAKPGTRTSWGNTQRNLKASSAG